MPVLNDNDDVIITDAQDGKIIQYDGSHFRDVYLYNSRSNTLRAPGPALIPILYKAVAGHVLESVDIECLSGSGTFTAVKRLAAGGDSDIVGITSAAYSTTPATYTATPEVSFAIGDSLLLHILTASSVVNLSYNFKIRRLF